MPNSARTRGHDYERAKRLDFREIGFDDCETSRYSSREKDDNKIDLDRTDPFDVQTKCRKDPPEWKDLLYEQMPQDNDNYNVLLFKRNTGRGPKHREYAYMKWEDWEEIYQMYQEELPGIPAEFNEIELERKTISYMDKWIYEEGDPKIYPNVAKYIVRGENRLYKVAVTKWREFKRVIEKLKQNSII